MGHLNLDRAADFRLAMAHALDMGLRHHQLVGARPTGKQLATMWCNHWRVGHERALATAYGQGMQWHRMSIRTSKS